MMTTSNERSEPVDLSVIIPFHNEAENIPALLTELDQCLPALGLHVEIIMVNDASTDCYERPAATPRFPVVWLDLTERSGQSAAMYFGISQASGRYVAFMDADLQNDPRDLEKLYYKLNEEGLDLITGLRIDRKDSWFRKISSKIANKIRSSLLGDNTRDTGCSLKVMRSELAKRLPGWNGMHRFIPALAQAMGYRVGECPVNHRPRRAGKSKVISWKRAIQATVDLIGMIWFCKRQFKGRLTSHSAINPAKKIPN
ncbi:glycosyl transferase [Methylacidiphilum kamchatkense Kam1]|uniref:Glycosyl transferase n=1 Tax=Methylacidiphilum kamchatkense Kam1 TaxID=1202785 RepID=A0A0C1RT80_9BACT|nr:glycosyltransferase family 2 protein [Methylacidiphilum kamchatkense]KIE58176.1 glycosyl transferase [Methylacidiphilum kamchatkense Kam1]QDQ42133.1 glycosyltransferase involved in cell wall biosynthesis [Methylacidiphilum kamchatkense Kam1]